MKRFYCITALIIWGISFFTTHAVSQETVVEKENYYTVRYRELLDYLALDYPERRMEVLENFEVLNAEEKQEITELIYQRDLSYLASIPEFRDLWRLRYKSKWDEQIIPYVGETARFFLIHRKRDLDLTLSEDVGILSKILEELRQSKEPVAIRALVRLVHQLRTLKDQQYMAEHDQVLEDKGKEYVKGLLESFEQLGVDDLKIEGLMEGIEGQVDDSTGVEPTDKSSTTEAPLN